MVQSRSESDVLQLIIYISFLTFFYMIFLSKKLISLLTELTKNLVCYTNLGCILYKANLLICVKRKINKKFHSVILFFVFFNLSNLRSFFLLPTSTPKLTELIFKIFVMFTCCDCRGNRAFLGLKYFLKILCFQ